MNRKFTSNYFADLALLENRNYGLDVMRAIGLLMILVGHSLHFFDPFFPKIYRISHFVMNGVELFFSLSGFLIGGILVRTFINKGIYTWEGLLVFLKRRWYKTLPVYYLAVLINYCAGYFVTGNHHDFNWKYLVFIQNLTKSDNWFFPVSYTLSMEEWFYLLFPFLFFVSIKLLNKKTNPYFLLLAISVLYIIGSTIIRTQLYVGGAAHWDTVMRKSIMARFDCSVYGVLMALLFYKRNELFSKYSVLMLVGGILLYLISLYFRIVRPEGYFYNVLYFTTIPLSFALMIPWFYKLKVPGKGWLTLFTYLSIISFAIYLFHLSPMIEIALLYTKGATIGVTLIIYLIYLVLLFIIATTWYKRVERPFTNLRNR